MAEKRYTVSGRVTSAKDQRGMGGYRVEAWDKDLLFDDSLGSATTGSDGSFTITFDESRVHGIFEGDPEVYVKVLDPAGCLVHSTRDEVRKLRPGERAVFEISVPDDSYPERRVAVIDLDPETRKRLIGELQLASLAHVPEQIQFVRIPHEELGILPFVSAYLSGAAWVVVDA